MARVTRRRQVIRYAAGAPPRTREDVVAVEEPLQIRLRSWAGEQRDLTVTMRTPGHDFDLVAGFLVGEGLIRSAEDLATMRYCAGTDEHGVQTFNVIDATLAAWMELPPTRAERQVTTSSACGICGTTSIEDVVKASPGWPADPARVSAATLLGMPERLRAEQPLFARTGGVHAAGLFGVDGGLRCVREDVGRHNAVDKVIGAQVRDGALPLVGTVLQVSGRASFELVQKARLGGIPVLSAVGAPSSLAVELADETGLTLVGFSRGASLNVYTHPERVVG
ncbi:MAG: formate dehydrogenase accessory sulfurtransferase FdhD [Candidatus Phosphoribacter sp.]